MLEHVACIGLRIDDDHVRLQLGYAVGQIHVRRQRSNDIVASLEQPNAQYPRPLDLGVHSLVILVACMDDGVDDNNAQVTRGHGRWQRVGPGL